jgi:hypothetical protein
VSLTLSVEILGDFKKLTDATKGSQKSLSNLEKTTGTISKGMIGAFTAIGAAISVTAIKNFASAAIEGAEAARVADQRVAAINVSMGLFGEETQKVTDRLLKYADSQEQVLGVEAETIKATQAKLLTFKELAMTSDEMGGAFDRATIAAVDLAAAGFGSAETNAVQLGKALNDPIAGLTALNRSGITFTEIEREKITALVESGQILEAQEMILAAVETQVGGTAEATATASERMKLAFGEVMDMVGEQLLPIVEEMQKFIVEVVVPAFKEFYAELTDPAGEAQRQIGAVGEAMTQFAAVFKTGSTSIKSNDVFAWIGDSVVSAIKQLTHLATFVSELFDGMAKIFAAGFGVGPVSNALRGAGIRQVAGAMSAANRAAGAIQFSDEIYRDRTLGTAPQSPGAMEININIPNANVNAERIIAELDYALRSRGLAPIGAPQ